MEFAEIIEEGVIARPVCEVKDWMASLPRGVNTPSSMRTTKDLMPRWHVDTGSERGW